MQRREFLALFAGAVFPSELRRYPDPSTELEVIRLTDPAHASILPRHGLSRRGNFLVYATDRGGTMQACRMDLKSGESRQITDANALQPETLHLLPDDRGFLYCDAERLLLSAFNGHVREIAAMPGRQGTLSISEDSQYCAFTAEGRAHLVSLGARPQVTPLTDKDAEPTLALIRPRRTQVLYFRADGSSWLVNFDGQGKRPLKMDALASPSASNVEWTPLGRTFAYLNRSQLREHTPDENADRILGNTSQFAGFGTNGDGSVFVGASGSKASPYVLLLLRVTRREFTLCEHRASDAASVSPVFTPNSQSILFQSDRHGKTAIYRMRVEKLVESTDAESAGL